LIVDHRTIIDLRQQSQPLPRIRVVHIPYFYIAEGIIDKQDLQELQQDYQVVILTEMSEAEQTAAEMFHYQSHRVGIIEAKIIILAKRRELPCLLRDTVLQEVCCQEGVAIVEYQVAKA
jgi:hypothetical protein